MNQPRTYLDWNASAPLRPEARAAMIAAMDEVGNPSSVHAEGRRAKAIVERARAQVADLVGCDTSEVVFTSGATEAAAIAFEGRTVWSSAVEHDCVFAHRDEDAGLFVDSDGLVQFESRPHDSYQYCQNDDGVLAYQAANSETGVVQDYGSVVGHNDAALFFKIFVDMAQAAGRVKLAYHWYGRVDKAQFRPLFQTISGHKFGSPKGVGALIVDQYYASHEGIEIEASTKGGGQEHNRRAGTENVIGIAGFGAAAEAAQRDLANGEWDRVEEMRNSLEEMLKDAAPDLIIFGEAAPRLPNTSCFAIPGWRGETQVMQMDLAGFAISAGSACSSGKVNKASRVLLAMGFDDITASSAVRVSMGPTTTQAEITAFADAWIGAYRRWKAKAA